MQSVSILCLLTSLILMLSAKAHILSLLIYMEYFILGFLSLTLLLVTYMSSDPNLIIIILGLSVPTASMSLSLVVSLVRKTGSDSFLSISSIW